MLWRSVFLESSPPPFPEDDEEDAPKLGALKGGPRLSRPVRPPEETEVGSPSGAEEGRRGRALVVLLTRTGGWGLVLGSLAPIPSVIRLQFPAQMLTC